MFKKFTQSRFVPVILAIAFSSPCLADAKSELAAFNAKVNNASGRFTQTVVSPEGQIKQQGTGDFAFAKPGRFKWNIQKPFPQLIVSNGTDVVTFDPDLEQASIRSADTALNSTPSALLFGSGELDQHFNLTNLQTTNGVVWLEAKPKSPDSLFDRIVIGLKEGVPVQAEIYDSLGQVTKLTLSSWEVNAGLPKESFEFKAPQGIDVIRIN